MGAGALPVERLRQYFRELPPGTRALLIAELERAMLRGEDVPGGDMLVQELRVAVRHAGENGPRLETPARLFFRPLDPFLVNTRPIHKMPGRIARSALEPIWAWISRDLVPAEAKAYSDDVARLLASGEAGAPESRACAFQDRIVDRIVAALAAADADDKARRRLAGQVGTTHAVGDVRDIARILAARDALALLEERLPGHVGNFFDGPLDGVRALLESPLAAHEGLLPYALVMVSGRLATPWQLIRLAVNAAQSDEAARIAATPYAIAVDIVLHDVERMVEELRADLKRGTVIAVISLLKCIHDAARGLRTELDLSTDSAWARELAAIRSEISDLLRIEIESVPGRVRRLLRPRPSSEIARNSTLNADDVAETEALIGFVGACRNFAGELAINEMTLRTFQELQQYLDTGTRTLLDALRGAGEADRPFRKSQVDAAVRFCAKAFGRDYASLLAKAAELAVNAERKVAKV